MARLRSGAGADGLKKALPEGTVRKTGRGWEEVKVPPTPKVAGSAQRRMPISELPEYAQLAFAGVKELNQLQVRVRVRVRLGLGFANLTLTLTLT